VGGDSESTARKQFLCFTIRSGEYAIPIERVQEILQYEGLTPVPGTPPEVRGVSNHRGSALPVFDLGRKFGLREATPTGLTCTLVVEAKLAGEAVRVGLLADSVREVLEIADRDVQPPPDFGRGVAVGWLTGLARLEGRFALLLDVDRVLAASEAELRGCLDQANPAPQEPAGPAAA
jgi:purine-binding chemotaxis protein CheW